MTLENTYYTIELEAPGTWAIRETPVHAFARGMALDMAKFGARLEGAALKVRAGRKFEQGELKSVYRVLDGRWVHVFGAELRGVEGMGADGGRLIPFVPKVKAAIAELERAVDEVLKEVA